MRYIAHVTLTTGHSARSTREDVAPDTLAVLVPWLRNALSAGRAIHIPGASDGCSALVMQQDGALLVTVYGPQPDIGVPAPLATFGVASRSRHAHKLWEMLRGQPWVLPSLLMPGAPWCAVVPYPSLLAHSEAAEWLGDFERCVAWAWVTKQPDLVGL